MPPDRARLIARAVEGVTARARARARAPPLASRAAKASSCCCCCGGGSVDSSCWLDTAPGPGPGPAAARVRGRPRMMASLIQPRARAAEPPAPASSPLPSSSSTLLARAWRPGAAPPAAPPPPLPPPPVGLPLCAARSHSPCSVELASMGTRSRPAAMAARAGSVAAPGSARLRSFSCARDSRTAESARARRSHSPWLARREVAVRARCALAAARSSPRRACRASLPPRRLAVASCSDAVSSATSSASCPCSPPSPSSPHPAARSWPTSSMMRACASCASSRRSSAAFSSRSHAMLTTSSRSCRERTHCPASPRSAWMLRGSAISASRRLSTSIWAWDSRGLMAARLALSSCSRRVSSSTSTRSASRRRAAASTSRGVASSASPARLAAPPARRTGAPVRLAPPPPVRRTGAGALPARGRMA